MVVSLVVTVYGLYLAKRPTSTLDAAANHRMLHVCSITFWLSLQGTMS